MRKVHHDGLPCGTMKVMNADDWRPFQTEYFSKQIGCFFGNSAKVIFSESGKDFDMSLSNR